MSSPDKEQKMDEYLKAGHPPAVKIAGGVRVAQHKPPHEKPRERKISTNSEHGEEEEEGLGNEEEKAPPKTQVVVSGAVCKGDSDFPPEAVKAFHEKPAPSHDYRAHSEKPKIIHQPR